MATEWAISYSFGSKVGDPVLVSKTTKSIINKPFNLINPEGITSNKSEN
jgi:hypothetical protein